MNKQMGLWIDHKGAVILTVSKQGEDIQKIASEVGKHIHYQGATHPHTPYSAQYQQADDQLDNKFTEKLNKFYDQVIARIRAADSVLILGPGEAKLELKKRLAHKKVKGPVVEIETADKMTEAQFAAKVRRHFQESGTDT